MNQQIRVIVVEDDEREAATIIDRLRKGSYDPVWRRVDTREAYEESLRSGKWDLVLSAYDLRDFSGLNALQMLRKKHLAIPFVVFSEPLDEKTVEKIFDEGADDIIVKGFWARLVPVVKRELRETKGRLDRQKAQQERIEAEARYRRLFENMVEGIFVSHKDGFFVTVNPAMARMLGYETPEELMAHILNIEEQLYVKSQDRRTLFEKLAKEGRASGFEVLWRCKDGSVIWIEIHARAVFDENGEIESIEGIVVNITEQKKVEKELSRLATAIEQAAEGVLISDMHWNILYVNPALEKISGYTKSEIIGARTDLLKSGKHDSRFYGEIKGVLKSGNVWSGRLVNKRKDGTEYEAEVTASPVRDESGEIINFVAVHRDITHEARLERHLRRAQKMEAIGTLAGGIAHDFNNILTAIMCYTEMAITESEGMGRIPARLNRVLMGCQRAKELVNQIITFSRQREREQKPVLINSIIKETLKLLSSSLPKTIEIHMNIESGSSVINADPSQIHQVLLNLCTNAAHAMRENGGVLEVTLQKIDLDETSTRSRIDLEPGPYVKLVVSDTGHGIDESVKERIFEPFFTTKPKEEGSGMGLSVVHGIVKGLGGAISVYSEPGFGSTFNVYFPRIDSETQAHSKPSEKIPPGTESILYVDDEQVLVEITTEMLESIGYKVTATTDGMEALDLFRTSPEKFDLIVTDMTMPRLTGETLARECLRIRPAIPIILCTGFSELITEEKAKKAGIRGYIMKPLLVSDLAKTIRNVLDNPDLSSRER